MELKKFEKKLDKRSKSKQKTIINVKNPFTDPITGKFKKGNPGGPGHPMGVRNWQTIYWQAIKRLAKRNNSDPDDLDLDLVEKGILEARKGNFIFWKEIKEANFGKVKDQIEHSGNLTIGDFLNKINES